ncbi:hypothetical protein ACIGW1_26125 [Streptomyces sp. NPDC053780]|uniref:hypothetical protein n=1 Tax=unclassified Streptomyces TaxID=2593676 RepID=UPI0034303FA4
MCAVVLAGGIVLASGPTAWADIVPGGEGTGSETQVDGGQEDEAISATAGAVVFDRSNNGSGQSAGPVAAATNRTPPACYYAPKYTPAQLEKTLEPIWQAESTGYQWDAEQRDKYVNGNPYKNFKGKAEETPPCGVKYLRSSGDGSYNLTATVTWKIHWTGTGVAGEQTLPDGEFGKEQDVIVQKIQAVNR